MKTKAKSHPQIKPDPSPKKQSSAASLQGSVDTGEHISTNSSQEDARPKRLGESQTEITDETTI